jgi:glucose/arabinose dehydrogenase
MSPISASHDRRFRLPIAALLVGVLSLAGCGDPAASPDASLAGASPSATASAGATASDPTPAVATDPPPSQVPGEPPGLALDVIAEGLDSPLDIAVRPDDPSTLYIVEQGGRVRVVRDGTLREAPLLDIADRVTAGGEQGLLGLAFHPDAADDRLFVYYTASDGDQVVSSFRAPSGPDAAADPGSEARLMVMDDPFGNHNGGGLAFGPDGYLYIATGDGGGGGDPLGSGRDLASLLGKVLRIDIDVASGADPPYAIPADNPYAGDAQAQPETWASGLRNPWRIRFDSATGDLWMGDVGQGDWEEIDVARDGVGGLDFGWNVMEGTHCFQPSDGCSTDGLTLPVTEYGHDLGCSVTGGTVYRGTAWPALQGFYVFSDYCSGLFWAIPADAQPTVQPVVVLESGRSISAIAEDGQGELVATDLRSGELLRISAP